MGKAPPPLPGNRRNLTEGFEGFPVALKNLNDLESVRQLFVQVFSVYASSEVIHLLSKIDNKLFQEGLGPSQTIEKHNQATIVVLVHFR